MKGGRAEKLRDVARSISRPRIDFRKDLRPFSPVEGLIKIFVWRGNEYFKEKF